MYQFQKCVRKILSIRKDQLKMRHSCTTNRVSVQGLNYLGTILHVYAGGKKNIIIFQKEKGNTFTLLIIFIVKSLQKEQNSTNLLL